MTDEDARADMLGALVAALEFYTRIPRPRGIPFAPADAERSATFLPFAGWVVGATCALVYVLAIQALPPEVAVTLALLAGVALTGALHEDGFADTCDAFGARADRERTLEILKDPRCGAFAVTGLVLLLLLKVVALTALAYDAGAAVVAVTLIAAHALSRLAAVLAMRGQSYARAGDASTRAGGFAAPPQGTDLAIAAAFGLAPLALFAVVDLAWAIACVIPVAVARWLMASMFARRIGGYTGDCLGAVQQVAEVLVLLTACAAVGPVSM